MTILDNYMFRPLLAIFRLSSRELNLLLYIMCAHVMERSLYTGFFFATKPGCRNLSLYSFLSTALEGLRLVSRPGRFLPPGKTRYTLYRRPGGAQGRSGQVRKISPPPGFEPRAVQPVASRYTD